MDKNTVFVKTKEGDDAVRHRTRLVQRNLRNILIMVDGHATVADLARRFGDEATTHAALADLMNGGFIVVSTGAFDFTPSQPPEVSAVRAEDVPVLTAQLDSSPPPDVVSETWPKSQPPVIEEIELQVPEYESLPLPQTAAPSNRASPPIESGQGWVDRIKALVARKDEVTAPPAAKNAKVQDDDVGRMTGSGDLEPIRRDTKSFSWPVRILFSIVGIAVLLGLTLVFYPYGRHLPDIEQKASAIMQAPVKIGGIGFSFMPRPHIVVHKVTVGKNAHLNIASVRAVPDLLSLLGEKKIFNELEFDGVSVKDIGLGQLAQAGAGAGSSGAEIRHITLSNMSLSVGEALLGGISGEVMMSGKGVPEKILLRNVEGTLKVELQPMGGGYRISAGGSNWKAPFKPSLTFQSIDVRGELRDTRLDLSKIEGRAYDGQIEGKASLDWAGSAALTGNFDLKHMNATKLLAGLGADLSAEGELTARFRLDAKADKLAKLADALSADASFEMKRGAVKGFDLVEAARRTGNVQTRGGETGFEQLSGTLQCAPKDCRLSSLRLSSGLFKASGNLVIAGNAQLSGGVDIELKSSAATLRMPLTISGSTKDPLLTHGRSR